MDLYLLTIFGPPEMIVENVLMLKFYRDASFTFPIESLDDLFAFSFSACGVLGSMKDNHPDLLMIATGN